MEGGGDGEAGAAGPPPDASPFLMEDVLHRLRLLRYEEAYLAPRGLAPLHKYQFSTAGGNANQFPAFVGLVTYLLGEARRRFAVDRFDDPATVLGKLASELRAMGAPPEMLGDFQPLKLRTGCGEVPCRVLLFCADAALAAKGFKWARPAYPEEQASAEVEEDEDEGGGAGAEDGVAEDVASEEDVLFAPSGALGGRGSGAASNGGGRAASGAGSSGSGAGGGAGSGGTPLSRLAIAAPAVDGVAWRAEVERAGARLRAPVRLGGGGSVPLGALGGFRGGSHAAASAAASAGSSAALLTLGEWRGHLEGTQASVRAVGALAAPAFARLRALTEELTEALGSVGAREAGLNTAYAGAVGEHGACAEAGAALGGAVASAQSRVAGLSGELAAVGEALEEVKAAMEERGSAMADASPLIRIKAALAAMRGEIKDLDVQLGVLGHAVMQQRLEARHSSHLKLRAAASAAGQRLRAHNSSP